MIPTKPNNEESVLFMASANDYSQEIALAKNYLKTKERSLATAYINRHLNELMVKAAQIKQSSANQPKLLPDSFSTFNLFPKNTSAELLKNSHYAASSAEAIHQDWQKIGNDLWQSCAKIKDEHE